MKIINFGSLGKDYVYDVERFVEPGETIAASNLETYPGGKGLNQSIALANAGAQVAHVGLIGNDGISLKEALRQHGVDVSLVKQIDGASGHAIIQRNAAGENSIVIYPGANAQYNLELIEQGMSLANPGDVVLVQNEINAIPHILEQAKSKHCPVVFNVAPANEKVLDYPLELVDIFIINETEGQTITGQSAPDEIFKELFARFPKAAFVLTLGDKGAKYQDQKQRITIPAETVKVVDTTAAGDTFTGYFIHHWLQGKPIESCLKIASNAAAVCIGQKGASVSIPMLNDLKQTA